MKRGKNLRKIFSVAGLMVWVLVLSSFLFGPPAWAAGQECQCFCATEKGAVDQGAFLPEACQKRCQANQTKMLVCAQRVNQYPSQNPRCFTQAQCTAMQAARQEKCQNEGGAGCDRITTKWGGIQPKECMADSHYCYAATVADIKLGLAIGGAKTVTDFGDYINKFYTYLLYAGLTIAVVMVMVGGVQYVMFSAAGKVDEAKTRIQNAVIGLVLLLLAYVILYTVNPVLTRMEIPRLPMVKGMEFLGDVSCESLFKEYVEDKKTQGQEPWIEIVDSKEDVGKTGAGFCGSKATVKIIAKDEQLTAGMPDACEYRGCSGSNLICIGLKDQALCTTCESVGSDGDRGLEPSANVCSMLIRTDKTNLVVDPDGNILKKHYCWFTRDQDFFTFNYQALSGTCVSLDLDCQQIKSCSDYDTIPVKSASKTNKVELDWLDPSDVMKESFDIEQMCLSDPCRWHRTDKNKDCFFIEGIIRDDCRTKD